MCYPDRSSNGNCIHNSFTVCKTEIPLCVCDLGARDLSQAILAQAGGALGASWDNEVVALGALWVTEHLGRDQAEGVMRGVTCGVDPQGQT